LNGCSKASHRLEEPLQITGKTSFI
jgi:hypothetical protein